MFVFQIRFTIKIHLLYNKTFKKTTLFFLETKYVLHRHYPLPIPSEIDNLIIKTHGMIKVRNLLNLRKMSNTELHSYFVEDL